MTDWEVEALNEDEAFFFPLTSVFSFFVNMLFLFVLLCLKPCLCAYCFFFGRIQTWYIWQSPPIFYVSEEP